MNLACRNISYSSARTSCTRRAEISKLGDGICGWRMAYLSISLSCYIIAMKHCFCVRKGIARGAKEAISISGRAGSENRPSSCRCRRRNGNGIRGRGAPAYQTKRKIGKSGVSCCKEASGSFSCCILKPHRNRREIMMYINGLRVEYHASRHCGGMTKCGMQLAGEVK